MAFKRIITGLLGLVMAFAPNYSCKPNFNVNKPQENINKEAKELESKESIERKNLEKRLFSISDFNKKPLFDKESVDCYFKEKDNNTFKKELKRLEEFCDFARNVNANNDFYFMDGMRLSLNEIINDYVSRDVPLNFIKEVYDIRKSNNKRRFDLLDVIELGKRASWMQINYLREIVQESGFDNFTIEDICNLSNFRTPIEKIKKLMNFKRDGRSIIPLEYFGRIHRFSNESISEILSLKDNNGDYLFNNLSETIDELDFPKLLNVDVDYIKEAAKRLPNNASFARKIITYFNLGIKAEDIGHFNDTEKPNALVINALYDWNGAFSLYGNYEHLKGIMESHDLAFEIVNTEKEFKESFERAPNYDLILIGGHGLPGMTYFGEFTLRVGQANWLKNVLKNKLSENAFIVLTSCYGAHPFNYREESTAEYLSRMAEKGTVYANYGSGGLSFIKTSHTHPHKASFMIKSDEFNLIQDRLNGLGNWIYCGRYNSETQKIEQLNPIFMKDIKKK